MEQVTAKMSSDTDVHLLKICLCCCYRDETGALSGDEASRNHGGVSAAKRSESPNSFLDQESRRREEEEPVYCTTPTYGSLLSWLSVCVRGRNKARGNRVQSHAAELSHFRKNKNHYLSMNPPAGPAQSDWACYKAGEIQESCNYYGCFNVVKTPYSSLNISSVQLFILSFNYYFFKCTNI